MLEEFQNLTQVLRTVFSDGVAFLIDGKQFKNVKAAPENSSFLWCYTGIQ
jgi:hypothetical protein